MSEINKRRLVFSIIQFLNREMASDEMSEDAKESLEVASQCLQTAFSFSAEDVHLEVSKPLEQIFNDATQNEPVIEAFSSSYVLSEPPDQDLKTWLLKQILNYMLDAKF